MKKILLILAFFLAIINPLQAAEIKGAIPKLVIPTFKGTDFDLKDQTGKIVIVNFWAKWCSNCYKERQILNEIYNEYKGQNIEIIGINIDGRSERKKVQRMCLPLAYPNGMLYEAKENSFEDPEALPVSYIIDKKGKLKAKIISSPQAQVTKESLEAEINPLLDQ